MIRALAAVLFMAAQPAMGDPLDFPALYRVTGVAVADVLNVRQGPSASTPIIATLSPRARDVEVLAASPSTGWVRINSEGGPGYVNGRFLERQPGQDPRALPLPLFCVGAEPFWGLEIGRRGNAILSDPEAGRRSYMLDWSGPAAARGGAELGARLVGTAGRIHAVLQRQSCTDGMSDRDFALKIDAIVTGARASFMLTGCCSLAR